MVWTNDIHDKVFLCIAVLNEVHVCYSCCMSSLNNYSQIYIIYFYIFHSYIIFKNYSHLKNNRDVKYKILFFKYIGQKDLWLAWWCGAAPSNVKDKRLMDFDMWWQTVWQMNGSKPIHRNGYTSLYKPCGTNSKASGTCCPCHASLYHFPCLSPFLFITKPSEKICR